MTAIAFIEDAPEAEGPGFDVQPDGCCREGPAALRFTPAAALGDEELLATLIGERPDAAAAERLIRTFGGMAAAITANPEAVAAEAGPVAAVRILAFRELARRLAAAPWARRSVLSSWSAVLAYLQTVMAGEAREQFRVLFLDRKNQLIRDEVLGRGSVDHAPVYPREVMRRALELGASAMVLAHNHPSGDPTPSQADIDMTRQLVEAARALGLKVHDHIVVGAGSAASLRALGLMESA